ncbi:phosphoribosylglycinamide formyltransferase-1 [Palleronia marisminoris]|uniref:Phosphoribosylglycinamide formyltransferase n=1 Tax=Palleronia marisminoris TaxID=315423 RepID=A0A1Y5RD07_9RHOB|nr:phosphoribosylglycinamide formyltransferase [Palleronia marisminoris]SFG13525.1 phosphoribosylglycinamide formyltransferase-1 [Palleronia marisminoris]SLN14670.1 Phosphoribosylglycinamide formyltransferase [Palleronia marisminoris]
MKRVAILLSGGGSNMACLVHSMTGDHPARPCLVLSNDPEAGGLKRARDWGIETAAVDHRPFGKDRAAFEAALSEPLRAARPDVICLAGFMRILTADFIAEWKGRMLNIHPSLLPKYRGLHTHARALDAGETEAGCTVHEVIPDLDAGPILGQARVPVMQDDDPATLAARVLTMEHRLYPAVLHSFVLDDRSPVSMDWPPQD